MERAKKNIPQHSHSIVYNGGTEAKFEKDTILQKKKKKSIFETRKFRKSEQWGEEIRAPTSE